jgi:hypothetical protein
MKLDLQVLMVSKKTRRYRHTLVPLVAYPGIPKLKDRACSERRQPAHSSGRFESI